MNLIFIKDKPFLVKDDELTPLDTSKIYEIKGTRKDARSVQANKALHLYCKQLAEALNDAGYSVSFVLNHKRFEMIDKVFEWGIKQITRKTVLQKFLGFLSVIFNKMKDRILAKEEDELTWTMLMVKDSIWRTVQIALLDKESTTTLEPKDIDLVYKNVNAIMTKRYGISIRFPSQEELNFQQNYKETK